MDTARDDGTFLYHTSCPKCGSSDARGVYSTGTSYCFSCSAFFPADDTTIAKGKKIVKDRGLITGDFLPLSKRGINQETCRKFGYTCGTLDGKPVQIANYYRDGELTAQHIRFPDKSFKWLGDTTGIELYGQHLWRDKGKRLMVTEGEIDCLTVAQVFNLKWQAVSVPNGAASAKKYLQQQLEWLTKFDEVVILFDADEPGKKAARECAALFKPGQAKIATYPEGVKDVNDLLKAGRAQDISTAVFEAKTYRPDGIIAGTEIWEKVESHLLQGGTMSYPTQFPTFNQKSQNLRKGEIIMSCAGSGIGKSTLCAELAYHMMMTHSMRIGYVALEESITKTALRMMSIEMNKPLHLKLDDVQRDEYEKAYKKTVGNGRFFLYNHFGSLDSANLLSKLKYLATGCECDFIVLDHISIAISGQSDGDERRLIDNLMTNLRSLVEETGVGMLVVSHLKKADGKSGSHEEGAQVSLRDLRGSGALYQLSDTVIGMERDQQAEGPDANKSMLRVLKCRFTGDTGPADELTYVRETGRLHPSSMFCPSFPDEVGTPEKEDNLEF